MTPTPPPELKTTSLPASAKAVTAVSGKRVLVMGLGRFGGGVGVSRWLVEQGARVTVTDVAADEDLAESLAQLAGLPITYKLGGHDAADFVAADLVVTNPAVDKARSEYVQAAARQGVALTTELNLFLERCQGFTIGVTGSVGKSTTTMLIYLALRAALHADDESAAEHRVFLGGNIGKSLLAELPRIRAKILSYLKFRVLCWRTPRPLGGRRRWRS